MSSATVSFGGYPSKGDSHSSRHRSSFRLSSDSSFVRRTSESLVVDARWVGAFKKLQIDGEVHKDNLRQLLIVIGHHKPDEDLVRSVADEVTTYSSMADVQVYEFVSKFVDELHKQLGRDFSMVAKQHGGKATFPELEALVARKGFTPIPHAIKEVLAEVAAELGESPADGVSLNVYVAVMDWLEQNEGFCCSDLDILEAAFQQFDANMNGTIEQHELRPLLESLDFFVDTGIIENLVKQFLDANGGALTWKDFLCISRKRLQLEYDMCQSIFKKCDDDRDGLLKPGEVMRMVSKLGFSLLPETFIDLMDECDIDTGALDYQAVWKMLQSLRAREGFTVSETADIHKVFRRFDSSNRGEMPLKRVQAALMWLGYGHGPGTVGKAHKQVETFSSSRQAASYMVEAQFLRLARKHKEAQLKTIRKVFRAFAADGGAGKLQMENMQAAVTRLSRLFVNDFVDWIKKFRPGARFARKHVSFDFEDFRMIIRHCCDKQIERIHNNCGFSDIELSKLRIEFVKCTCDAASSELDSTGQVALFTALIPECKIFNTVHKRLSKAVLNENPSHNTGLDWHGFLRVMMTYAMLTEVYRQKHIYACLEELKTPLQWVDEAHNILERMSLGAKVEKVVTPAEVQFLAQRIAAELTAEEASEVLARVRENDTTQGELAGLKNLKSIVLSVDLSKPSFRPKAHDLAVSF